MNHLSHSLLALVMLSAMGCSSSSGQSVDNPADAGDEAAIVDAGADGVLDSSDAASDPLVEELCPGACAAAIECDERVEQAACLEQCAKEIAGDGYLIPEVALPLFEFINEDENEDELRCQRMLLFSYWKVDPLKDGVEIEVQDPAALKACVERYDVCWTGKNSNALCWFEYYRYNHAYRAPILECVQAPCSMTWMDCINEHQPKGQPWLAIPPAKSIWD